MVTRPIRDIMPAKIAIDMTYVANPNIVWDIAIILRTLRALFR